MPYTITGERTNKCSKHQNKVIYSDPSMLLSVILKVQEEQGIKLVWYRCEEHNGYHLTKFENKRD